MKKPILGALLAAVATFFWGFIFWATPIGGLIMHELESSDSAAVQDAVGEHIDASGVYFVPQMTDENAEERHAAGPLVQLFVHKDGAGMMNPVNMLLGLMVMFITALIFSLFATSIPSAHGSVGATAGFGVVVGLITAVWSNLGNPFWFYHPWDYSIGVAVYDIVSFTLIGVVCGFFLRD